MRRSYASQFARSARRGITIMEVMVVITGVTMILALCAVSIQVLMRSNADVQGRFGAAVTLERLARQFRDDAHSSESAELAVDEKNGGKPSSLRLVLSPAHIVVYEPGVNSLVRTESKAGKVVRHENYALTAGTDARLAIREEASRSLLALVVSHTASKSRPEPPRPLEVVALQGKDRARPHGKSGVKPK